MQQSHPLNREIAVEPVQTALLFIDVQNFCANRNGEEFRDLPLEELEEKYSYYFHRLDSLVIPNLIVLQQTFRKKKMEILYTTIESLTLDGRDRSLDYKITGFNIPKGSWEGRVIDELAPLDNEIWLPKSSSSVFISTHIDYILRNLGIRQLVIAGVITDQCVESAVRDACDLGYLVTLVSDGCATYSQQRHDNSLKEISGYCRQRTTSELMEEIAKIT